MEHSDLVINSSGQLCKSIVYYLDQHMESSNRYDDFCNHIVLEIMVNALREDEDMIFFCCNRFHINERLGW
jgi:hypothetical protein